MFVRFYCLRLSHPQDRDHCTMNQDTAVALLNAAKSIKRRDMSPFLTTIQNSAPSSSLNVSWIIITYITSGYSQSNHDIAALSQTLVPYSVQYDTIVTLVTVVTNTASLCQVPTTQDTSSVESGDGAHLYHMILSTLHNTDSTSPWIPSCALWTGTRSPLSSLYSSILPRVGGAGCRLSREPHSWNWLYLFDTFRDVCILLKKTQD